MCGGVEQAVVVIGGGGKGASGGGGGDTDSSVITFPVHTIQGRQLWCVSARKR